MFSYTRTPDPLHTFGLFRRRMDHLFREFEEASPADRVAASWPSMILSESDDVYTLRAEVPGLSVDEIDVRVTPEAVTLAGERKVKAPEGYSVHRQERRGAKFSRSVALPARIDTETASAEVKDGVLTVKLPKHPELLPRSIQVKVV